jgi:integrase
VDSALRSNSLASVSSREIQAFVQSLSATLSPATVRVTYQHLRSVFRAAEADRIIGRSPCQRINLPRVERHQVEPLSTEMVLAIEREMPDRWRAIIRVMAGTGVRPGEAAGITLDRLDFLRRTLRIDRQLLLTRPPEFGPPKTESSRRTIPLPQVFVGALAAHVAAFLAGEHGLVFSEPDGAPLNRDHVTKAFRRAVVAAAAPPATRLHDLRHYYASLLIRHGESVKVVQARLGHASAKETLDTYSHLWSDSEDLTRTAIDAAFDAALAQRVAT